MELIGKTFGRLKVVEVDKNKNGCVICECACGNRVSVKDYSLIKKQKPTRSCGCLRREVMREIGQRTIRDNSSRNIEANRRYNTNFQVIENNAPPKNNKSGYKGVWYDAARGTYESYISVHRNRICLGRYRNLEDAVSARKEAEDKLFAPLIAARHMEYNSSAANTQSA